MNKGAQTRAAILNQATAMAGVHGLEGMSIGRLATVTGMSKSGLFSHFGSKEALQQAVLDNAVADLTVKVIGPAQQEARGEARLRALFRGWLEWGDSHDRPGGCPIVSASIEFANRPGELHEFLADYHELWLDRIRRMCQKAVSEGNFREGLDTRQFASEFHSIGLGFNLARRLLKDENAMQYAYTALDRLIRAVKH